MFITIFLSVLIVTGLTTGNPFLIIFPSILLCSWLNFDQSLHAEKIRKNRSDNDDNF
jgi:hypothetical protein